MTICIASDSFPPRVGGIATFNQHLVSLITKAGHKAIVLVIDYEAPENQEDSVITEGNFTKVTIAKSYFKYYRKWKPYFRPGGFDAPNWIAIGMAMQEWLLNNHRRFDIDIIEASDYGGIGIFLCRDELPPILVTGHGSLIQLSRYNNVIRDDSYSVLTRLETLSFLHADRVITHSLLNKKDLEKRFNRLVDYVTIPWSKKNIPGAGIKIESKMLVVGGLQPIKGAVVLADAMMLLHENYSRLIVEWVGTDTWLAPGQKKMSDWLSKKYPAIWQKNFFWKNEYNFEKTQEEIAAAEIIIIPAVFETFNYIALEAASCKKPIIITDNTGAVSLFTHSHDAWIIPANDPASLAAAILKLNDDPGLCRQLGENAYKTIIHHSDPARIVDERLQVYQQAMQDRQRKNGPGESLLFLDQYRTSLRKYYYCTRRLLKRLAGRT